MVGLLCVAREVYRRWVSMLRLWVSLGVGLARGSAELVCTLVSALSQRSEEADGAGTRC